MKLSFPAFSVERRAIYPVIAPVVNVARRDLSVPRQMMMEIGQHHAKNLSVHRQILGRHHATRVATLILRRSAFRPNGMSARASNNTPKS